MIDFQIVNIQFISKILTSISKMSTVRFSCFQNETAMSHYSLMY